MDRKNELREKSLELKKSIEIVKSVENYSNDKDEDEIIIDENKSNI